MLSLLLVCLTAQTFEDGAQCKTVEVYASRYQCRTMERELTKRNHLKMVDWYCVKGPGTLASN